ncbi:DUF6252 family protein [Mesonia aquimarina]|uniref:DUF6252 family protein n=1 Tax=Mesonia aquimarina TaxID=1504967 RepID=UPI000EF609C4|nr:DUF6252 family protein [Mesonia aquimarina]
MRKNLLLNLVIVCLSVLGLQSCDNEPYEGAIGGEIPGLESNFQVDIDGETFVADQANATTTNGITTIVGIKNNGETVSLTLQGSGTGSYDLEQGSLGSYIVSPTEAAYLSSEGEESGSVNIETYNLEQMFTTGTFSFSATRILEPAEGEEPVVETVELTNGIFTNIPLTSDVDPTPTNAIFEVELDGELFTSDNAQANITDDGLEIAGTNGNAQFAIQIFDPAVGSFDIGGSNSEGVIIYNPDSTDENGSIYSSIEGTLTISEIDMQNNTVSGVFEGVLEEATGQTADIEMTLGVFENIPLSTMQDTDFANAKIDGEDFTANIFPVVFQGSNVIVTFDNNLNESIGLQFPDDVSTGTYPITDSPSNYSATYIVNDNGTDVVYGSLAGTGEIEITSVQNDIVEGTFSFDAENDSGDTVTVTEGQFSIDISF